MNFPPALLSHPEFADIDRHFARFIGTFSGGDLGDLCNDGELPAIAAALLSRNVRQGHICLDLNQRPANFEEPLSGFKWPALDTWQKALSGCRAVQHTQEDQAQPLILDAQGHLYLRRYWDYERKLATAILERCAGEIPARLEKSDLQALGVQTALARRFVVISGGPGTGKTTTVLKILESLVSQPGGAQIRIALSAPTGKAAARLQETLRAGNPSHALQAQLPQSASTLHRLLGVRHGSIYFRHDAKNPLPVDLVVVDEASMVPLPMMAKLFDALPERASIILLGDRYQLASVEPGAVLGDIADAASEAHSPLQGSLVVLKKNYRFGNESAIFALGNAVREGEADRATAILNRPGQTDICAQRVPPPKELSDALSQTILSGYSAYLRTRDPAEALKEFQKFRVLCALRSGPYGVEKVNQTIEAILRKEGYIGGTPLTYAGLPVIITRNDYQLRLYNGDIGILLPDPSTGSLVAWFVSEDGAIRHLPPARLPAYEPAYAMTVHKSQGSEFESVLLLLPHKDSPVLTRELVYTGLTRARSKLEVWFEEKTLRAAITRQMQRVSGLRRKLCAE